VKKAVNQINSYTHLDKYTVVVASMGHAPDITEDDKDEIGEAVAERPNRQDPCTQREWAT